MTGEMENSEAKAIGTEREKGRACDQERGKEPIVPLQAQDRFATAGGSSCSVLSGMF